jgi:T-complex protein 1 subunit delta
MELSVRLRQAAQTKQGAEQYCWKAFAEALELIPYTLAENAGLSPIGTVTELRTQHALGNKDFGVNVRTVGRTLPSPSQYFVCFQGAVTNILEEGVVQPLLVTSFAVKQAAECVRAILKIDDVVLAVR